MSPVFQIVIGIGACAFFVWLMFGNSTTPDARITSQDDLIDPSNSYQIGFLIGMTGGTVTDASVARYALERFEQTHGYKPTLRDAALVVGLMQSQQ